MDAFEQQLNSTDGPILVLYEGRPTDAHRAAIDARPDVVLADVAADRDLGRFLDRHFALVICVGATVASTHEVYAAANVFKECHVPVVFGTTGRGLFHGPPTWKSTDLTIAGMFWLGAQFVREMERPGDYLEFGVFDGRSFTLAYHALKDVCGRFYGFDSFQGIVGARSDETHRYPEGSYYANIETFRHNLAVAKVDASRVVAVEGSFQERLTVDPSVYGLRPRSVSVCYVDSDVYEAALLVLRFVEPLLMEGALLMFDEYHAFAGDPNRGERRAVREWLAENPQIELERYRDYTAFGRTFMFRRKA